MSMAEYSIIRARRGQISPLPAPESTDDQPAPAPRERNNSEDLSRSSGDYLL